MLFNCPVRKGKGDPDSYAGDGFNVPKRAIKMLPDMLDRNGEEAFFLAVFPLTPECHEKSWTIDKVHDFLRNEMSGWNFQILANGSSYKPDRLYVIVSIYRENQGYQNIINLTSSHLTNLGHLKDSSYSETSSTTRRQIAISSSIYNMPSGLS